MVCACILHFWLPGSPSLQCLGIEWVESALPTVGYQPASCCMLWAPPLCPLESPRLKAQSFSSKVDFILFFSYQITMQFYEKGPFGQIWPRWSHQLRLLHSFLVSWWVPGGVAWNVSCPRSGLPRRTGAVPYRGHWGGTGRKWPTIS